MKRVFVVQILLLLTVFVAGAVKARPGLRTITQPDGTVIKVRVEGDERHHRYLSEDGYPLEKTDGFFRYSDIKESYADINENGITRAEEESPYPGLFPGSTFPVTGEPRVLVILAEFADVSMTLTHPYDYFHRMLNEPGFSDYGGTGSVRDYFIASSGGKFSPEFDLYGPVTLPHPMVYYGGNDASGNDRRPVDMIVDACEALDDEVDFSLYDCDGDGFIDNVFVFYAGEGEASSENENTIWPHSWYVSAGKPGTKYLDGVILDRYACSNEWVKFGELDRPDGTGTFIHEFSHVMGLPDLYSITYSSAYTPGEWTVLDVGSYNNDGCTPPLYSSFERSALGWLDPFDMRMSADITLQPLFQNEAGIIPVVDAEGIVKPEEFFLVENRQQEGWDKFLPGHGMLIWHVDYDDGVWWNNEVNSTADHQRVDLVEAAGELVSKRRRDADPFPGSKKITAFTESSRPAAVSWDKVPCGVALTDIAENDGVITFRLDYTGSNSVEPGAVESVSAGDGGVRWRRAGQYVYLENLNPDSETVISDITGKTVASVHADSEGNAKIFLPVSGIYVVNDCSKTLKIKN